jgi:hypothetical protein
MSDDADATDAGTTDTAAPPSRNAAESAAILARCGPLVRCDCIVLEATDVNADSRYRDERLT